MYRLSQADKIYYVERNKRQRSKAFPQNRITIGEFATVKEAAERRLELMKQHPDKIFYVAPTWNKPKQEKK